MTALAKVEGDLVALRMSVADALSFVEGISTIGGVFWARAAVAASERTAVAAQAMRRSLSIEETPIETWAAT